MYQSLPRTNKYCVKLLLLCSVFHLCSAISGQSTGRVPPKINLSAKNVTITDVFKAIKSQTGKIVWFMNEEVNADRKVTVNFQNATLDEVMEYLFGASSDFTWSVDEEKVILRKKKLHSDNVITSNVSSVKVDSLPGTITVTGKVTDEKGSPIIGATVVVAGTRKGTTTGVDGGFVLEGVKPKAVLTVTSISYLTRDVPLQGKSSIGNVSLKEFVKKLDETVVIAYSTTTQRTTTGNVSVVSGEEIRKQPVTNPLLALQGRVPGLVITQENGISGGAISVQIRGQNSLYSGNDPFYVIDGVPYSSQLLPNLGGVLGMPKGNIVQSGNPLSYINPSDIESISVLKDADATSIYGSRAANGAILITTRKGNTGTNKVDINMQQGWGKVSRKINVLNLHEYLAMRNEALLNDGIASASITDYDINGHWDTTRSTNWQKELLGKTSQYTNAQLSASGGNTNIQYLVGAGYKRITTVFPDNFADRKGSIHFNITSSSSNQKFRMQISGMYMVDNNQLPNDDLTSAAVRLAPDAPSLHNKDGSLNWAPTASGIGSWSNPLAYLVHTYLNKTNNLVSNGVLSYQIFPGLELKSSFGYTNMQTEEMRILPAIYYDPFYIPLYGNLFRSASYSNNNIQSWIIDPQITYNRILKKGKLNILLGASIQQNNRNGQILEASGFNNDLVIKDIRAAGNVNITSTSFSVYKYNAAFARISYNFNDKYLSNFSGRRDGSSRFGSANHFHNFWAVGLGWIFSKENLIQNSLSFLSYGKLRGSYGVTGNDQIPDYGFLNLYSPISSENLYQGSVGLEVNGLTNPYLQWEETRKIEFGLDLAVLNDNIFFNTSYFRNRSSNQLIGYSLPVITGTTSITRNLPATVQNSGWEFSFSSTNIERKNFNWSTNINLTIPKNKLISYPGPSFGLLINQPINIIRTFHLIGVNQTTGVYEFGDDKANPTLRPEISDYNSLIKIGSKFYGGVQNNLKYKSFELGVLFQFVKQLGLSGSNEFGSLPGFFNSGQGNQPVVVLNRWQHVGDKVRIQKYSSQFIISEQQGYATQSDGAYVDASFIRLKNLSFSWQVPEKYKSKAHLENARLFIQGQNLLTITKFKGLDPESINSIALPPLLIFTIGAHITL